MSTAHQAPDILSPEFEANPYQAYRLMRDAFPLFKHEATGSYVISRYEDVEYVFKDRKAEFTTENYDWQIEPVHGRTILQLSGGEHATRRALVAPAFRGSDLREKFLPVIERNSRELIDGFRASGSVDLVADYASRFPVNVIADMLGLDTADYARFHGWYTAVIAFLGNLSGDPEVAEAGERTRVEFAEYMLPIIRDRRENPGDDLLSTLCTAEVDGVRMSDEDVKAFCSLLLAAGGETTDKAIAGIFANLLLHPGQLEAVRADHALIPQAFAETLRFTPPVHMIMRQAATDVELSGGTVPAGATVTCLIGAANRDGSRYRDPDTFDIFRTDLTTTTAFSAAADHLAFALGRHFCVGALLAKAEVEIGVGHLLTAMPDLRLADGFDPVEHGVFTRGPKGLPLRFTPVSG
ncbi:cytochrome P450 [Streptomyces sp. SID8374]|uniref:cytochrome P450 n=1 Tax=Streptomyces sp. SID8374 TaxID=2690354 RepID=UPI001371EE6F|nr:cytochrome P450 [Streptomyces sp. SID8374]MYX15180.1 cytochrome P450 [Streptomyces sp. SID8374]